jgi:hypothetical protein
MGSWAYEFTCERSLYEMQETLDRAGPWRWGVKDCAWYPDFVLCRPCDGVRICLYEQKPPGGPGYRCHVEIAPGSGHQRSTIDPIVVRALDALPATGRVEVDPREWPFD